MSSIPKYIAINVGDEEVIVLAEDTAGIKEDLEARVESGDIEGDQTIAVYRRYAEAEVIPQPMVKFKLLK